LIAENPDANDDGRPLPRQAGRLAPEFPTLIARTFANQELPEFALQP
jgi:hypothetical protein